ncbi:integrase catalytic domain-containing protein [Caerostris extrusa]|uniref:Integrase catalytic domain-containing protein n=1 Tax=Caerostris extrusa TaxID=172846 RepID=A0AAV4SR39_CAEEX|nr:integrase catalytic domain-containing protein [Caerostris extrusa]
MSIHVFCDACKTSYATCIFLRNEFQDQVTCQLLQARSRVAPLKNITIVRLELLACCIGARLADTVKKDLKLEDVDVFYCCTFTDFLDDVHSANQSAVLKNSAKKERKEKISRKKGKERRKGIGCLRKWVALQKLRLSSVTRRFSSAKDKR